MKGLLVCLAVGCLAIASAAPAEESNKQIAKHLKFHNDGLFDYPIFSVQDELVTIRCKNTTVLEENVQKCSIHLDKLYSYDQLNTSCYIPSLKLYGQFSKSVVLANDGNSRAVIALRDGRTKLKLISVNLKDCKIYETSVNTSSSYEIENDGHLDVAIVAHDKNYDVFFQNWRICRNYLCKATIDYEGKVVKAAAVFPIQIVKNEYLSIQHVNNGYLVMQRYDVLLVKDGEDTARLLLRQEYSDPIVSSTEENKITSCFVLNYKTAMCKQYDVDGKIKISEFKFQIDDPESRLDAIAVQNTEKGLILAASEIHRSKHKEDTWVTYIVSLDDQGKQLKYVKVDLEFNKPFAFPILYKNSNGQYCAQFVQTCMNRRESPCTNQQKGIEFFINTRCFSKTELF